MNCSFKFALKKKTKGSFIYLPLIVIRGITGGAVSVVSVVNFVALRQGHFISWRKLMGEDSHNIPFWQRIFDSPFLLLAAGLIVMFAFYTIWGLIEIYSLPQATLP